MISIRKSDQRGFTRLEWLKSRHTFSFAGYHDEAAMGYSVLRVINDDTVAPGGGFAPHSHSDMEILTWVLTGALEHRDSLGNGSIIRPGDAQRMTAGSGITHSEFNHSRDQPVHFLQIWIVPAVRGLAPGYEQTGFPPPERAGRFRLIASPDGADGSVTIHQDARIEAALLDFGARIEHDLSPARRGWLHVARGFISLNDLPMGPGDGAAIENESRLSIAASTDAELLLFDLP